VLPAVTVIRTLEVARVLLRRRDRRSLSPATILAGRHVDCRSVMPASTAID